MQESVLYLSADDVTAAMPPVAERLELAERTMTALVADAELPPKIGVHPRPTGSFAHAMPAALRPTTSAGSGASGDAGDLLGIKWVAGFPDNRASSRGQLVIQTSTGPTPPITIDDIVSVERIA